MTEPEPPVEQRPTPDWSVYSDATCAGLSALIPVPLLDLAFEAFFRHRMPRSIAAHRGARLDRQLARRLGRSDPWLTTRGCLMVPLKVALWVVKRLVRKLVYVLTVADAAEGLSAYWHRAYLLDHVIRAGHLQVDPQRSLAAFELAVKEGDTSPLKGLARQVAGRARRVLRLVLRARRDPEDATAEQVNLLRGTWPGVERSLRSFVDRYELEFGRSGAGAGPE